MHLSGEWILLIFIVVVTAMMLLLLHLTELGLFLHQSIPDRPHRRMFLASISFFITFLAVRLLVASIQHHSGPSNTSPWVAAISTTWFGASSSIFWSRLFSILYGVGAALTLDEFALWLNLANVYWSPQGRESIDAVMLFGSLLAIGTWGAPVVTAWRRKK
jgi:hypothetical protein